MTSINKIRVGETQYNLVPMLGTGLCEEDGTVGINLGSGMSFSKDCNITMNIGSAFTFDEQYGSLQINLGTASIEEYQSLSSGIAITPSGFMINAEDFRTFLKSIGVQFN